jgi:hypothetical protein
VNSDMKATLRSQAVQAILSNDVALLDVVASSLGFDNLRGRLSIYRSPLLRHHGLHTVPLDGVVYAVYPVADCYNADVAAMLHTLGLSAQ